MNSKALIKSLLPNRFLASARRLLITHKLKAFYKYDAKRFALYSNVIIKNNNKEKLIGQIIAQYHSVEKGLTMPNGRFGFGKELVAELIKNCWAYIKTYGVDNDQLKHAVGVIGEYKNYHDSNGFVLNKSLSNDISALLTETNIASTQQYSMTKERFFRHVNDSFDLFSSSRHSLRSFEGQVDLNLIKSAVQLAQNAPSACNRQQARVYVLQNKQLISHVLDLQTGNRGFGHLADKLIILTAELGGFHSLRERNDVYVNGGIFAMNLLYALHHQKIGACVLNWCVAPTQDLALRDICKIVLSETVIVLIACGGVPDKFMLANSPRTEINKIIKII